MKGINIIIVEDEPLIAEDIAGVIQDAGHRVLTIEHNSEPALDAIANQKPDLVFLDISIEGSRDGIEIAGILKEKYGIPFIFITSHSDSVTLGRAKTTTPLGYIVKPFTEQDILTTLEISWFKFESEKGNNTVDKEKLDALCLEPLTPKEFEILLDLKDGLTNQALADKHFVSINTIKTHLKKLFRKMDVGNRTSAIAKIHPKG